MEVIDNFQMSSDDFKKDQLKLVTAKLIEKIKESIEARAQIICEQIQNSITWAVSCDDFRNLRTSSSNPLQRYSRCSLSPTEFQRTAV